MEDAARHVAESVEDIPELHQLNYLSNRMRDLNDPTSDTWKEINEEVQGLDSRTHTRLIKDFISSQKGQPGPREEDSELTS